MNAAANSNDSPQDRLPRSHLILPRVIFMKIFLLTMQEKRTKNINIGAKIVRTKTEVRK
jgi:hypothetical protein